MKTPQKTDIDNSGQKKKTALYIDAALYNRAIERYETNKSLMRGPQTMQRLFEEALKHYLNHVDSLEQLDSGDTNPYYGYDNRYGT
jgi:hypothetical protein